MVDICMALFHMRQINCWNSCNDFVIMTARQTVSWGLVQVLVLVYKYLIFDHKLASLVYHMMLNENYYKNKNI